MIEITREFAPADRYIYDFKLCTYDNGWAQVDTSQDASYYGTWTNPVKRMIFSYCEGDTTLTECTTDEEYKAELLKCADWNKENGYWRGIDPGYGPEMKERFAVLGLSELLH